MYVFAFMCVSVCAYVCACMCVCVCVYLCECVYVCASMCVSVRVCVCFIAHLYAYICMVRYFSFCAGSGLCILMYVWPCVCMRGVGNSCVADSCSGLPVIMQILVRCDSLPR